jgi:hypothetical protein
MWRRYYTASEISIFTFSHAVCDKNAEYFVKNSDCHGLYTRQNSNLHMSQVYLTIYGEGVFNTGVKVYNDLPYELKTISDNPERLKSELKEFLYLHSFYTLAEFFNR